MRQTFVRLQCRCSPINFSGARQRGQVLIIILVFAAILGAALLSLYNVAQLSITKQRLNGAADAAAYSGAAVIAQGLNYTAYTNRAMLANSAMIGQMVSLRSTLAMSHWYWKNTETTWKAISALTKFIPYVGGVISGIANGVAKFSDFWGDKVIHAARRMAEYLALSGTAAIGLTNQVMWASQQVQLAESLGTFEAVMLQVAKDNAPDAQIDAVMHATAFGPLTTLGMFAYEFEPKVRIGHRTLGTNEAKNDSYLQFVNETNRHAYTQPYIASRQLLPNAVGLWIATGCNNPPGAGSLTGLFEPNAGLGGLDTAITTVQTFASFLSPIANTFMCMFERQGGTELVQLKDGKLAWTAVDAMGFNIPLLSFLIGTIPYAGGAVTSFVDDGQTGKKYPESVRYFVDKVKSNDKNLKDPKEKYFGHKGAEFADCVEYMSPLLNWYTVSTSSRNDGACAVLGSGTDNSVEEKGLWGGDLAGTADKTVNSSVSGLTSFQEVFLTNAEAFNLSLQSAIDGANAPVAGGDPSAAGNAMPAGVSGNASSGAVSGLPNTNELRGAGTTLQGGMAGVGGTLKSSVTQLTASLNPNTWKSFSPSLMSTFNSAMSGGGAGGGEDGGPGFWAKLFLKAFGLDAIIDVMKMKISDGVETPRHSATNKVLRTLADGLPKWFWDVRVQKPLMGGSPDVVVTDNDAQDYHPRRYGLGPLVYAPLLMDNSKLKTAQKLPAGGPMIGLPDYNAVNRPGLRAIGKARVFYRQPNDQWLTRYKIVTLPNLLLPYWQARNEGLSYADKWGLLALDGLTGTYDQF